MKNLSTMLILLGLLFFIISNYQATHMHNNTGLLHDFGLTCVIVGGCRMVAEALANNR